MRLRALTLQDFRNVVSAELRLSGLRQFFVGANGQGKTNLLEAAGCLTALRSFRTSETAALVRHGSAEAGLAYEIESEQPGPSRVVVRFRQDGKELWWDQERVKKIGDHLGHFPVVAFSSQDLQLVRGPSAGRRRWLDLTLSAMDGGYLKSLQAYTRALAERNRLLKTAGSPAPAELAAFEHVMADGAADVARRRISGTRDLAALFAASYRKLSGGSEEVAFEYQGSADDAGSAEYWRTRWAAGRPADIRMRGTLQGPHRDDIKLKVSGEGAREFASEGQQRSLALSLRLAQTAWFQAKTGVRPVILADDVLGELDPDRRRRFWGSLDPDCQVLASGTSLPHPELGSWEIFEVADGRFKAGPVAPCAP